MRKLNAYGYGQPAFERIENGMRKEVKDQRGHLVARRFGGEPHHLYNMSPHKPNLNQRNQLYVKQDQNHGNNKKSGFVNRV